MHASLGAGEIVSSITSELQSEGFLNGTMQNAHSLAGMAGQAAHEGTRFAQSLYPFLPQLRNLTQNLSSANHLASQSVDILDRLNAMSPAGMQRLDQFMIRVLVYFFIFGVGMAAIWWSAYYFVKRRLTHQAKEDSLRTENNRKSA
jgi:hypothetical protein